MNTVELTKANLVRQHLKSNFSNLKTASHNVGYSESTLSRIQTGSQVCPEWMDKRLDNDLNSLLNKCQT